MTIRHMCLDVRGAIKNFSKRQLTGMFTRPDGTKLTAEEAREHLLDHLSEGHEVIPMGRCNNFDWKEGCRGHATHADADDEEEAGAEVANG